MGARARPKAEGSGKRSREVSVGKGEREKAPCREGQEIESRSTE